MTRPRIGTVLLLINLVVLALPLSGLWMLRLYESALLRQTEAELIAQGAVVVAAFRAEWRQAGGTGADLGALVAPPRAEGPWTPHTATLDLADDPILPVPPPADPAPAAAAPSLRMAGERITQVLRDAQRVTLAGVRVVDRQGVVVATTREELGLSLATRDEVRQALAGQAVSLLRQRFPDYIPASTDSISRGANLRVFVALPIIENDRVLGAAVLSRTPRTILQSLYGKRWHLAGLGLVLLVSVAGLAVVAALTIARPLRAVTAQAKRVADGEAGPLPRIERPMTREVAELSDALARMAATLDHRAAYIQGFAAQVSHEFKTPLAAIRGTVELLRDHLDDMTPEQRGRFLANLDGDAERLDRLVRRLLDLARAEMTRAPGEGCDMAAVVSAVAERYRADGLSLTVDAPPGLPVQVAAEALETVLRNLLDNVRQHAPGASVMVSMKRDGGQAVLCVADDGPGVSPANAPRVFDRFFTTARKSGGTGLGLAIAQSLLAAQRGGIALVTGQGGAVFEIRVPLE